VTDTEEARFSPAFRAVLDRSVIVSNDLLSLVGGDPQSVVQIERSEAEELRPLLDGETVTFTTSSSPLLERLLDLGFVKPQPSGEDPRVSDVTVVIPVHNHAEELRQLLSSKGAFSGIAGVVVVDDGSPDPESIRRVCQAFSAHEVHLIRNEAPLGPAGARNRGVDEASTELIVFIDADCRPETGWLIPLLAHFEDRTVGAVASRLRAITPEHSSSRDLRGSPPRRSRKVLDLLLAYELEHGPLDRGADAARVGPGRRITFVPTAALAVRRKAWDEVGGFDETLRFGEDIDFSWRIDSAGWRIRYEPSSIVHHEIRRRLVDLLVQRYRYGTPAAELAARYPEAFTTLEINPLNAAEWVLAGTGFPTLAAACSICSAIVTGKQLRGLGVGWRAIVRRSARDQLHDGAHLAWVIRRDYWPLSLALALLSRRMRRLVVVSSLVPPLVDWVRRRPRISPPTWIALTLADGLAHGAGVWMSCLRHRTLKPLSPAWSRLPPTVSIPHSAPETASCPRSP